MRRMLVAGLAATLLLAGVACSPEDREEARETTEDVGEEVKEGAEEAAEKAKDVANDRNVRIKDNEFDPKKVRVTKGQEVTWINDDDVEHSVKSKNDTFDSDPFGKGEEFSQRFTEDGKFKYFCEIHGEDTMSGTVVVGEKVEKDKDASPKPSPTATG